jgi:hypothetical protein
MNTYPKAMQLPAPAVGYAVANDADELGRLAALGYVDSFAAPQEAQPQPPAVANSSGIAPSGAAPSTVEEARAVLDALGISYHHRAGLERLLALISSP